MHVAFIFSDGEMCTRIFVIIQLDLQNALQNMLRGAFKSGNYVYQLFGSYDISYITSVEIYWQAGMHYSVATAKRFLNSVGFISRLFFFW